jgi:PTS system nitrogen regulatory IIA component
MLCGVQAQSRKRVLEYLGELFARDVPQLTSTEIYDCLLARERLGSTGLGHGVAVPHARLAQSKTPLAAFVELKQGVAFDAPDNQPVYLVLALLVPADASQTHLELLAEIAGLFATPGFAEKLRETPDLNEKYRLLTQPPARP